MKTLILKGFITKEQYRIQFTNFLKEYGKYGLKESKVLLDRMIDGEPIEIELSVNKLEEVEFILKKLNMNYSID